MSGNKLIVGNWKMNGLLATLDQAKAIATGLADADAAHITVVICPPATLIAPAHLLLADTDVKLGGQDCHGKAEGAHTGDISAAMLADAGARYVIVGHSERRSDHLETSAAVNTKAAAAIGVGLVPIICVGETQSQRDAGQAVTIVLDQLNGSVPADCEANQICIAYEPVWAIGTGRTPSSLDVLAMHQAIRNALVARFGDQEGADVAILYGGSVNAKNAGELLNVPNVDGALVGGASLTATHFLGIIQTQL